MFSRIFGNRDQTNWYYFWCEINRYIFFSQIFRHIAIFIRSDKTIDRSRQICFKLQHVRVYITLFWSRIIWWINFISRSAFFYAGVKVSCFVKLFSFLFLFRRSYCQGIIAFTLSSRKLQKSVVFLLHFGICREACYFCMKTDQLPHCVSRFAESLIRLPTAKTAAENNRDTAGNNIAVSCYKV